MPTYNIVDQGADDTGEQAIDPTLEDLAAENTTIIFPPGTYKLNELVVPSGRDNLKLTAPNGARLIPGQSGDSIRWIDIYSNNFVLDGFELDMRNTPIPPFVRTNPDAGDWELKRLVTRGKVRAATDSNVGTNDSSDARTYFRLSAADGTRGLLQDCYFHEGSCGSTEASNRRAILLESGNGELVFNRCWFELWAENTMYAKKPAGPVKIYNSFFRNTQNGMRLGGNSEVRNCVSIKNDEHPIQAWSGGSLQRGVNAEAVAPTDHSEGIDGYNGTLTITDSDFYHRYLHASCGGAITAPAPCERIDIQDVRITYNSRKWHDAIYTMNGRNNAGEPLNLKYLQLQNIQVRNDRDNQYAVSIDQTPETWGTVSGVLGGSSLQTDSEYVRNRVTTNGSPTPPNTTPPLPSPPTIGEVPMQSEQLLRIDNTGNESASYYEITADGFVLPAGDDGATVPMDWGPDGSPTRQPNAEQASGTVPAGEVHAFYVSGGFASTAADGPAIWTINGEAFYPDKPLTTSTLTADDSWQQVAPSVRSNGIIIASPLSYNGIQPAHVRLRDATDTGFEYRAEEWQYLDGGHASETFHTLAVAPAGYKLPQSDGTPYRLKAGTITASDTPNTASLGDLFNNVQPVIFTQQQTFNGPDPTVTRISDVSSGSFDVRVQEEEANGTHMTETVGYVALEQDTGYLDGKPFEVQRTGEAVTDEWFSISFTHSYETPRFFAAMQTFNGQNTANIRYRNLSSTGVEIKIEEETSRDDETAHGKAEVVGYAVFEGATLATNTISNNQPTSDQWQQVNSIDQSSRVVVAKPLSSNGPHPIHTRLRNVTSSGFEYKLEEWGYLDGSHTGETFHTLAVEPTDQEILLNDGTPYTVEAGTTTSTDDVSTAFLDGAFSGGQPVVIAQSQTFNGGDPIVTRVSDVSSDSFDVRLQEEGKTAHTTETIGYIALEQKVGQLNNKPFEVQRTGEAVTDEWFTIPFEQNYDSPQFLAAMQTFNGPDPAHIRYRNLSSTSVEIKIEEETSTDDETNHGGAEVVGYAVFEGE